MGRSYCRARYYHPGLQRFISEDPIGFRGGINKYAYVGNDPLGATDPFGLCQVTASFRPLGGSGPLRWSHAFITATDAGGTTYFGAFPNGPGPSSGASGALGSGSTGSGSHMSGRKSGPSGSSGNSAPGDFGVIVTRVGPYTPGVAGRDFAPSGTFPSLLVLDNAASCDAYNQALASAMGRIGQSNIPYDPFYNNSNAAAWTALESAGLDPGRPPIWAPGWGNNLLAPVPR